MRFNDPATNEDIANINMQIHELRIILFFMMDPEMAERFREQWFGNNAPERLSK